MRGHAPPELAPPGDDAARHARGRRRSTSELGGRGRAVSLTHNIDAISRRQRQGSPVLFRPAARGPSAEILIRFALRPRRR